MRELNQNETMGVNGGIITDGYNFSFIVENTVTGAIVGLPFAILTGNSSVILGMATIFGAYAVAMTVAKGLDAVFFTDPQSTYVPVSNVVIA